MNELKFQCVCVMACERDRVRLDRCVLTCPETVNSSSSEPAGADVSEKFGSAINYIYRQTMSFMCLF